MSSHIKKVISPPPPLLVAFENPALQNRCFAIALLLGLLWIALGTGDWFMRFHKFGWERSFIVRGAAESAVRDESRVVTNAPYSGGDLSRLIGIRAVAARHEEDRPAATNFFDAYGFRNLPPLLDDYPVVVVGDSYAATGPRMEDTFPAQLSEAIGQPVYNHAVEGRGTFWAIVRFFAAERFRGKEPRVVVWPVIEREVAGAYFEGGLYQISQTEPSAGAKASSAARMDWSQLQPATLRRSLPNTSAFSQIANRIWNRVRYAVFHQVNPAVVPSSSPASGGPMLFYSEAVRFQKWTDSERDLRHLVHAVTNIAAIARSRGMELVFVLIPDKERIYADALPALVRAGMPPDVLPEVERQFRAAGLHVVNLLPVFESAARRGELLFWRDDTHWNPAGVRLAAQTVAPEVRRLSRDPEAHLQNVRGKP